MKTNLFQRLDRRFWVILLALVLFISGFSIASYSETSGGTVRVDRVDFVTDEGYKMSAKLYIPKNATVDTPAPGILTIPGGNANLENLSDVAIELSRRGYVVMAIDPYTIGRSEIVNTPDVGSRAAMDYLMSLKFVDSDCIGAMGKRRRYKALHRPGFPKQHHFDADGTAYHEQPPEAAEVREK